MVHAVYGQEPIFRVYGGLEAGSNSEFTIKGETLADVVVYEYVDIRKSIRKSKIELKQNAADERKNVKSNVAATAKRKRSDESLGWGRLGSEEGGTYDGFKYSHMMPLDANDTRVYLPTGDNIMIMDSETGNYTTLTGTIMKALVPVIEDAAYLRNAVKIMGALLGIDMSMLDVALTGDKETYILLERIKNGDVPIFIPGNLFVAKKIEVGTEGVDDEPQFCSVFKGNYSTANWIRTILWDNITDSDDLTKTTAVNNSERWDNVNAALVSDSRTNANTWNYTDYAAEVDSRDEIVSQVCV